MIPNDRRPRSNVDGTPRVLVIDDHLLLASLLVDWLTRQGFEARAAFGPTNEAVLDAINEHRPDLLLLDDDLGPDLGSSLQFIAPAIERGAIVIMLASRPERVWAARCIEEGASGVAPKQARPVDLLGAINDLVAGKSLITPAERAELIVDLRRARHALLENRSPFYSLTEREAQALQAICDGKSASDIAREWVVSVATVRSHIRSVLVKLDVGSQLEAVALARRAGWPWAETDELSSPNLMMTNQ